MNLDEVDKFIIVSLLDAQKKNKELSSWFMAKKYPWTKEEKGIFFTENDEERFFTDRTNFIDYRLKKMEKTGLVKIIKNDKGKKYYSVSTDRIKKANHKFINKYAMALLIKNNQGKFEILEL